VVPERGQLLRQLAAYQLGISTVAASDDLNLQTLAGASNKAFEYLACGMPLLITREASWQELYQRPGYAIACVPTDARSIATAVASLVSQPEVAEDMGRQGRERIAREWNYETQFAPVLEHLSS
jgi:glycosyltransferase involved in cell wall biosynthesis